MVLTIIWDGKTSSLSAKGENLHFSRDCGYSFDAGKTTYTGADGKTLEFTYSGCKRPVSNTPVIDRLSITPVDQSVEVGTTVQYTAEAKDASNNVISGLSYTYSSSDTGKSRSTRAAWPAVSRKARPRSRLKPMGAASARV